MSIRMGWAFESACRWAAQRALGLDNVIVAKMSGRKDRRTLAARRGGGESYLHVSFKVGRASRVLAFKAGPLEATDSFVEVEDYIWKSLQEALSSCEAEERARLAALEGG